MTKLIAIVCGSHRRSDRALIYERLDFHAPVVVIEGAAPHVDTIAGEWARERGVDLIECPALWDARGRRAGPTRNTLQAVIAKAMETERRAKGRDVEAVCIAFDGDGGTANMRDQAAGNGVRVIDEGQAQRGRQRDV